MTRPKTQPTGIPPNAAKRSKAPPVGEDADDDSPDDTTDAGKKLRQVYTLARTRWESMRSGRPTKYAPSSIFNGRAARKIDDVRVVENKKQSEWNKLAKWFEKEGINGEEYVRFVFSSLPHDQNPPLPTQLRSEKYADQWEQVKDKLVEQMQIELDMQRNIARSELVVRQKVYEESYIVAARMTIGGGDLALSPLFRYCLACQIAFETGSRKLSRMVDRLEAKAVWQFEQHRALYKKVWRDILPKGFAKRSREVYPHLLAHMGV